MRQVRGSNDHPDSRIFAQVFRLLSTYSLIKPRRGSTVEVVDILIRMLNFKDLHEDKGRQKLCVIIDKIISNDDHAVEHIITFLQRVQDHNQRLCGTPEFVQGFVAGFVAFRGKSLTKCSNCIENVQSPKKSGDDERFKMIDSYNRGRLQYPSDDL